MEKELRSVETLRKLPIGMENFVEIRRNNFYYVDKTRLIEQLVEKWSEVSLFTRPRRFGKSLNMSMLRAFFEVGAEANLFDGLYISHRRELCEQYMGKYPVISFTLKNIEGQSFDEVKKSMKYLIGTIARQYSFLLESEKLSVVDKEIYLNEMVRTAKVTPEQLAALLRQSATTTPNPAALSAVGATFDKEDGSNEDDE